MILPTFPINRLIEFQKDGQRLPFMGRMISRRSNQLDHGNFVSIMLEDLSLRKFISTTKQTTNFNWTKVLYL